MLQEGTGFENQENPKKIRNYNAQEILERAVTLFTSQKNGRKFRGTALTDPEKEIMAIALAACIHALGAQRRLGITVAELLEMHLKASNPQNA